MDPSAIHRRSRVLLDLGRPAEALAEVRRALAMNPNDPEALEIEGLCWLRRGEYAESMRALKRSIAERPETPHVHYLLGFALRELGRRGEAEGPLNEALRLSPEEPVYLRAMAELCSDLGRHPEALDRARRAVELAPDRSANHITYGYVASAAGNKVLARAQYHEAVVLDPSDAAAWNNLGCLDLEAGEPLKARARFREALRLDPRGERARRNLTLVSPRHPSLSTATFEGVLEALAAELVRARAGRTILGALVLEAPAAGRALVRGGGRGAALSGAVTLFALRAMGPAAIVPLSVGAALAGAAWFATRNTLPDARARVRSQLLAGRREHARIRRDWLDGALTRETRDEALQLLVEQMALALTEGVSP